MLALYQFDKVTPAVSTAPEKGWNAGKRRKVAVHLRGDFLLRGSVWRSDNRQEFSAANCGAGAFGPRGCGNFLLPDSAED